MRARISATLHSIRTPKWMPQFAPSHPTEASMSDHAQWLQQGIENGWHLPQRPSVFHLPLIKRIAYAIMMHRLDRWYSSVPGIRTGYDEWVLYGWFYGLADGDVD